MLVACHSGPMVAWKSLATVFFSSSLRRWPLHSGHYHAICEDSVAALTLDPRRVCISPTGDISRIMRMYLRTVLDREGGGRRIHAARYSARQGVRRDIPRHMDRIPLLQVGTHIEGVSALATVVPPLPLHRFDCSRANHCAWWRESCNVWVCARTGSMVVGTDIMF